MIFYFSDLSSQDFSGIQILKIEEALYCLKVGELRILSKKLNLDSKENKKLLIKNIIYFLKYRKIPEKIKIPEVSIAKKDTKYQIQLNELMLKGSYKNDNQTKEFFQKHIGTHFHFTAFGIDWLNDRWINGNPPIYKEFIDMWVSENQNRKLKKADMKIEWAYMRFSKKYLEENPSASKEVVITKWNEEREKNLQFIKNIFPEIDFLA